MDQHWIVSACTLGNPASVGELIAAAAAGGFRGVQLWQLYLDELVAAGMSPAAIAARLAEAELQVDQLEGAFAWAEADEAAAISEEQRLFKNAVALGSGAVLVGSLQPGAPLGRLVEQFARLCEHAGSYGLSCRLEFLPWGSVADLHTAVEILYAVNAPNAGLLLDSWHLFRANTPLEQVARLPGELIHAVQLNDLAGPFAPTATMEETVANRVWPGEGWFDLRGLINALSATGTDASVSVEVMNPASGEPAEALARSARTALARLLGDERSSSSKR